MEKTVVLEEYAKRRSRRVGTLKKYGVTILFLLPFMLAFIVFFLLPLFYGIYISLTNFNYAKPNEATYNAFRWYRLLFDKGYGKFFYQAFWRSFLHTFVFALIMVPIAVILPLGLAILVNLKPPGYKVFRALIYMPSIVPLTAAGTIFTLFFLPETQAGLFAQIFKTDIQWFIDSCFTFKIGNVEFDVVYAWIPIFLMCLWGGWGGNFIILSAGLQNVPKNLYEACSIDGCSKWQKTKSVTIPGIKGQLVLCLFTTIIGYMGLYGQNYVLTNGYPKFDRLASVPGGSKISTVIYFIQDIVANNANFKEKFYGMGAAASIVFAVFVGIISGIQMFCTREKKTGTKISEAYEKWTQAR